MRSITRINRGGKKPHKKRPVKPPSRASAEKPRTRRQEDQFKEIEGENIELFQSIPAAAAIVSFDKLTFIEVNDAWCREFGYTREEALGRTLLELNLYDMTAESRAALTELAYGDALHSWQFDMRRKSGELIPYLASLAPLKWAGKECIVVVFQNLSSHYKLTKILEENATKFRSLFESSRDAIGVARAGIHEFVNPAYLELFGYTSFDELKGRPLLDLIAPDSRVQVMEIVRSRSTGQNAPGFYETRGLRRDGSEFDMEVKSSIFEVNGENFTLGLMRDITERKQAEHTLTERLKEMTCRSAISRALGLQLSPEELCQLVIRNLMPAMQYPDITVPVIDLDGHIHTIDGVSQKLEFGIHSDIVVNDQRRGRLSVYYLEDRPFLQPYEQDLIDGIAKEMAIWFERNMAEAALIASEQKYSRIVETALEGIIAYDANWHISFVNARAVEIFGYDRNELIGKPISVLILPTDTDAHKERKGRYERGITGTYEGAYRKKNGEAVWLQISSTSLSKDGRFDGAFTMITDITERRHTEEAQRRAEKLFQAIVEDQTEMIVRWKPDGTRTFVNQAYCRTFGKSYDELVGSTFWPLVAEPYRVLEQERIRNLSPDSPHSTGIHESLLPDGNTQWQEWSDRGFFDELGKLIELQSVGRDITEHKRSEQALRESETAYKGLFDSSVNAIIVVQVLFDENGKPYDHKFINGNLAYEQLTGTLVNEEIGKTSKDMFIKGPLELVERLYQVAITGEPIEYQRFNEQLQRYFETRVFSPRRGQFALVATDITRRKLAEEKIQRQLEQLTALREVDTAISSTFAMNMSLEVILNTVVSQLGVGAAAILLFNKSTLDFEYAAGKGFKSNAIEKSRIKIGEGITGRAALERNPFYIDDLSTEQSEFGRGNLVTLERFKSYYVQPLIVKGELTGVLELFHTTKFNPDEEWLDYLSALAGQAAIAIENSQLFEGLQRSNLELSVAYDATIEGWSHAMDVRDKETEGHTERVVKMSMDLARAMNIPEHEMVHFRRGALLHDMGKLGVPDAILLKPGELTSEEWERMRAHPQVAYEMLSGIHFLRPALDIPYCHHEKWDGSGYPRGLKGEEIPLAARIFAVVDVWDALTSDRPYRPAWTRSQAMEHVKNESGKHFDPQVVELFLNQLKAD